MQTALRKIGNSTGIVIPRAILGEIGLAAGASIDLKVEGGKLVGTPVETAVRVGWAEDAAKLGGPTDEEREWLDTKLTDDDDEWTQ